MKTVVIVGKHVGKKNADERYLRVKFNEGSFYVKRLVEVTIEYFDSVAEGEEIDVPEEVL